MQYMDVDEKEIQVDIEHGDSSISAEANLDKVTAQIFKDANLSPAHPPVSVEATATSMPKPVESNPAVGLCTPKKIPIAIEVSKVSQNTLLSMVGEGGPRGFQIYLRRKKRWIHRLEKWDLSNQLFLDLSTPTNWVNTTHTDVLMSYLGERDAKLLNDQGLAFASLWFASHLQSTYRQFDKAKDRNKIYWDERITKFIKSPGNHWLEKVQTIYARMIWDSEHWVGLAINLDVWCVEILDPLPFLKSDRQVKRLIAPQVLCFLSHSTSCHRHFRLEKAGWILQERAFR